MIPFQLIRENWPVTVIILFMWIPDIIIWGLGCQKDHVIDGTISMHQSTIDNIYDRQSLYKIAIQECEAQKITVDAQIKAIFLATKENICGVKDEP
jgi:hypothetical protein